MALALFISSLCSISSFFSSTISSFLLLFVDLFLGFSFALILISIPSTSLDSENFFDFRISFGSFLTIFESSEILPGKVGFCSSFLGFFQFFW